MTARRVPPMPDHLADFVARKLAPSIEARREARAREAAEQGSAANTDSVKQQGAA